MNPKRLLLAVAAVAVSTSAAMAEPPKVVASIMPLHSLASAVMQGVGAPSLLVKGAASPHGYQLRPSDAALLQEADIVFRVGPALEAFLDKSLASLAAGALVVDLIDAPGLLRLAYRDGDDWEHDEHDEHESGHSHKVDEHQDDDDHAQRDEHDEHDEHAHERGSIDPHVWLSPANASVMVTAIADTLARVDPGNAGTYADNAASLHARIADRDATWRQRLHPLLEVRFIVFHDAYHYLEHHYGLSAAGAITLDASRPPSAKRLGELRDRIAARGARCVFREPQFDGGIVDVLIQGTPSRASVLDPVGAALTPGADAWFELLELNVQALESCLSPG